MSKLFFLKSQNFKKIVATVAVLFWMGVIFFFSAQSSVDSGKISKSLGKAVTVVTVPDLDKRTPGDQNTAIVRMDKFLRSFAHVGLFAVLGFLAYIAVRCYDKGGFMAVALATAVGVLYSLIDEIHQYFVPGRTFEFEDIVFDFGGVVGGVVAVFLMEIVLTLIKRKRQKQKNEVK